MFTSIAILGRPNVGKSTLFNKLTNTRDAIVSDFSGLTKDRNYGYLKIGNISSLIVDTGGIDTSESIFTDKISEQAWIAAEEANLILFILDSSDELTNEDINILQKLRKLDKLFIPVLNKIDRKSDSPIKSDLQKRGLQNIFEISAEHSTNLTDLKKILKDSIPDASNKELEGSKIAVLGRPNAGKSTLINKFVKEERMIVSEVAGTTIDSVQIPFKKNEKDYIFIDTAGIRKKYKQSTKVEYFSYIRAIHAANEADIILLLCDITEGLVDQDLKLINLLSETGKPILLAFNKTDLLSKSQIIDFKDSKKYQSKYISELTKIEISADKGRGLNKLLKTLDDLIARSQKKYTTSRLNKVLKNIINDKAPPSVNGKVIKIRYLHFAGTLPTTFIIHASQDKKIPQNFKRYLENSFKKSLNLSGVQLRLIFRKSENPYEGKKNKLTGRQVKKRQRLKKFIKKSKS
jgi:GTP-binding protein